MGDLLKNLVLPFIIFNLANILSACNSSTTPESTSTTSEPATIIKFDPLDDENIAKAIYYNFRTPEDFYHEPERDRNNFYTIDHVKSIDVSSLVDENNNQAAYELCSQDFSLALQWSEEDAYNHPQYSDLMDNSETNLFYEFTRVSGNSPNDIRLSRVFKCDTLNKSLLSNENNDNDIGYISQNNLNTDRIKNTLDYLWTISPHNNFGYAILSTASWQTIDYYYYTMIEAVWTAADGSESCDSIEVFDVLYSVDSSSGLISVSKSSIKSISAVYENNDYRICQ